MARDEFTFTWDTFEFGDELQLTGAVDADLVTTDDGQTFDLVEFRVDGKRKDMDHWSVAAFREWMRNDLASRLPWIIDAYVIWRAADRAGQRLQAAE